MVIFAKLEGEAAKCMVRRVVFVYGNTARRASSEGNGDKDVNL
jgi:hypothetical protein